MSDHSVELAAAEAAAAAGRLGDGLDAMHWKPWKRDGLDTLGRTLGGGLIRVYGELWGALRERVAIMVMS